MDTVFESDVFEGLNKTRIRVATKTEGAKWEIPKITPARLKSQMYKSISKYGSIYKDNSWENVNKMVKDLERILPNLSVVEAKYSHDEFGVPNRKRWTYVGAIEDSKSKKYAVIVDITAAGAGEVSDPLSKYDITGVVNVLRPSRVTDPDVLDYMSQYKVEEKTAKRAMQNSQETNRVIHTLKKDKEAMEYIRDDIRMNTGEDFMSAFENALKEDSMEDSFKWNRVDWDTVAEYFLN